MGMVAYGFDRRSLKGSDRYSVWQRHTSDGLPHHQQPVGLRHNHIVSCVVAALQAALGGTHTETPPRCGGYHRALPWAVSVAALQAALDCVNSEIPPRCDGNRRALPWAVFVAALQAAFDWFNTENRLWYFVPRQSLKGSDRYSVWQRHTTDGLSHYQQPVGLRQN